MGRQKIKDGLVEWNAGKKKNEGRPIHWWFSDKAPPFPLERAGINPWPGQLGLEACEVYYVQMGVWVFTEGKKKKAKKKKNNERKSGRKAVANHA